MIDEMNRMKNVTRNVKLWCERNRNDQRLLGITRKEESHRIRGKSQEKRKVTG